MRLAEEGGGVRMVAAAAATWLLIIATVAPVCSLKLWRMDESGNNATIGLNRDAGYIFANSSVVGFYRNSPESIIYTSNVYVTSNISDDSITLSNYLSIVYQLFEFGPAVLDFDGDQILLRDKGSLKGLLLLSGWPRTSLNGQTDIVQQTGRIGSRVFILGDPYYNGSHIVVRKNGSQVAYYSAPGFPVIAKTAVTIQRLDGHSSGGSSGSAAAHGVAPSSIAGQIVGCTLHQAAIEPKLVRLLDNSNDLCTVLSLGSDIVQLDVSNSSIRIIGIGGVSLARLDVNITGVRHNGTHVVFEAENDVLTISSTSGTVLLEEGNSKVRINSTNATSIIAGLVRHDGVSFNGTHLTLGSSSCFYTPGRLSLTAGRASIVDDQDGSVSAAIPVQGLTTVREGSVWLGNPFSQESAVFVAKGLPHLDDGVITIRNSLGNITAEIFCIFCSPATFSGSQIDLLSGGQAAVSVHAEGAAILDGTSLVVVGENNSIVATVAVGLVIQVSKTSVTFAGAARTTLFEVVRQGLPLYNGSHMVFAKEDGASTLIIGLPEGPHIGVSGTRFGDQSGCKAQPCLTLDISGPFHYNGSAISVSSADGDRATFAAEATSVTAASGILRFLSSGGRVLATIEYAENATVYLDDEGASFVETIEWTGNCSAALLAAAGRRRSAAGQLDLPGRRRFFNGSHMIILDEDRGRHATVRAVGDLIVDTLSQSLCVVDPARQQVLVAFRASSNASLDNERLTIANGGVTYDLLAAGWPVYINSRVNVLHRSDSRVEASIEVGSLATLLLDDGGIVFRSEPGGDSLLTVVVNDSLSTALLSNGSLDVLVATATGGSESACRLLVGRTRVRYERSRLELTSWNGSLLRAIIEHAPAVARVSSDGQIAFSPPGKRNVTLDLSGGGVPHFVGGSVSIVGDQVAFTAEASATLQPAKLICKPGSCWLTDTDGTAMLEIDTAQGLPFFSGRNLIVVKAADAAGPAASKPYLVADVQSKLHFNGTTMASDDVVYEFEAATRVEAIYNGSSVRLVSAAAAVVSSAARTLAEIADVESVRMMSERVIFSSGGGEHRLTLPPAAYARIDTCADPAASGLRVEAVGDDFRCGGVLQLNRIRALAGVNASAELRGPLVVENGTARIGGHDGGGSVDSTKTTFSADIGIGSFAFSADELLLPLRQPPSASDRSAALSVGCSGATPRFSRGRVDFVVGGEGAGAATPVSLRSLAAVPRYNCTHVVLGESEPPLATFAVGGNGTSLRHNSTGATLDLVLVGAGEAIVAAVADIGSLHVADGVVLASERDGGEAAALLCAPGDVVYDSIRGLLSVLPSGSSGRGGGSATLLSVGRAATPTFADRRVTFVGARSNLTVQLPDGRLVVDSGKSVSVGRALFKIAGMPVDDGVRLRIVAHKDGHGDSVGTDGHGDTAATVLADIAYGDSVPQFVNGSVIYVDKSNSSSTVVVANAGRPHVFLRVSRVSIGDDDGMLPISVAAAAFGNGTTSSGSWIVARPDNASVGALCLLQRDDRVAFNGTHLAVYGARRAGGVDQQLKALISLSSRQHPQDAIAAGDSRPGCGGKTEASAAAAEATVAGDRSAEDGGETRSSSLSPCWSSTGDQTCGNGTSALPADAATTAAADAASNHSDGDRREIESTTKLAPTPSSTCQQPPSAVAAIVPTLGDDCIVSFHEDGRTSADSEPAAASVQLPPGCRLSVNHLGDVHVDDDAGALTMSMNAKRAATVSVADGAAVVRDAGGERMLTVRYKPGLYRLDGDRLSVIRPDGSHAIVTHASAAAAAAGTSGSEVSVSCREGTVSLRGGGGGGSSSGGEEAGIGSLAVELRLPATALSAHVDGSTVVALRDRGGDVLAVLASPGDANETSLQLLLNASHGMLSIGDGAPSNRSMASVALTVDLGSRGSPLSVYNGSHLVVLDSADGRLLAVIAARDTGDDAGGGNPAVDEEALWSILRDPPAARRLRLSVVGVPEPPAASAEALGVDGNETATVVIFRNRHTGKVTAALDMGSAAAAGDAVRRSPPPPAAPPGSQALVLLDELERPTVSLRVNGSLVIAEGVHVKFVDASDGTAVATGQFGSGGDWYSSFNGTHISLGTPSGVALAVVAGGALGAPTLGGSEAALLCPRARTTVAGDDGSRSAGTVSAERTFESLTFSDGPGGAAIVVCLRPEAGTKQNGSHWLVTDGKATRFVIPIPELTSATSIATADGLFTADPRFSPAVGPVKGRPGEGGPGFGHEPTSGSGHDSGTDGTVATRFVFIVMLTVCFIFLVGAAAMYAIMHWSNREHGYILSNSQPAVQ